MSSHSHSHLILLGLIGVLIFGATSQNFFPGSPTSSQNLRIGSVVVTVQMFAYDGVYKNLTFINLHENENTSVVAAKAFSFLQGGRVVKLQHGDPLAHHLDSRRITFSLPRSLSPTRSTVYSIDPNRMFTAKGREETLMIEHGPSSPEGHSLSLSLSLSLLLSLSLSR